jgi:hypothetical protein
VSFSGMTSACAGLLLEVRPMAPYFRCQTYSSCLVHENAWVNYCTGFGDATSNYESMTAYLELVDLRPVLQIRWYLHSCSGNRAIVDLPPPRRGGPEARFRGFLSYLTYTLAARYP